MSFVIDKTNVKLAYARETQREMVESFIKSAADIAYVNLAHDDIGIPKEDISYTTNLIRKNYDIRVIVKRGSLDEGPNGEDIIDWTEQ